MITEEITKERVTKQVNLFSKFMATSLPCVDELMEHHDWENDDYFSENWMQVNWEFLVEFQLLGGGGHLKPLWHRVTNKNAKESYTVVTILDKDVIDLRKKNHSPKTILLELVDFLLH